MQYKAIITDLDRTLLRTDKTLSEYTVSVLRKAKKQGVYIIAATARPKRTAEEFNLLVGFDAMVCLNGAESTVGHTVISNFIPKTVGELFLENICKMGDFIISAEIDGKLYANIIFPEWETLLYNDFPCLPDGNVHKIIVSYSEEALAAVDQCLSDELYRTVASNQLIQIMHKSATKWNGIISVLKKLNITPEDCVYFGDDNDDIEPIKKCGLGLAVSNGITPVKEAADLIISSNDEDGVAVYISENLLDR